MIYFIADTHFGHKGIIHLTGRPFDSVVSMNNKIISNWNSRVKSTDEVYMLGDVAFREQLNVVDLLRNLNGKKHLIVGNHDIENLKNKDFRGCFSSIQDIARLSIGSTSFVLCHYPIMEWQGYYKGVWHIYGHIHNSVGISYQAMSQLPHALNAGVEVTNYTPVTFSELVECNKRFNKAHKG